MKNGLGNIFTVAIFVITAVSNATNLTDGLDGLASGISAICGFVFAIFAYVSGRVDFSGSRYYVFTGQVN